MCRASVRSWGRRLAIYNHWTELVDWTGGLDWWDWTGGTGLVDWTGGTGLVDWTSGLDWWTGWWTGLVDWTGGLTLKIIFMFLMKLTHL